MKAAVTAALIALIGAGSVATSEAASAKIRIIRFPKPWTKADVSRTVLTEPANFEGRMALGSSKELIVTLRDGMGNPSLDFYRISLQRSGKPAPATDSDYGSATPLDASAGTPLYANRPDQRFISFENRRYNCSGEAFAQPAALSSPSRGRLLLFSYQKPKGNTGGFLGSGEPSHGVLYVDLFDLKTGRRLARDHEKYKGLAPSILFANARWFGEEAFLIPLDFMARTAILGTVPLPPHPR